MASVGSGVNRAIAWRERNPGYARLALERALELFDLSLLTVPEPEGRLRELTRARETLVDYFFGASHYGSSDASWRTYFDAFAHAAAKGAWRGARAG